MSVCVSVYMTTATGDRTSGSTLKPLVHEALGGYSYTVQLFLLNINVLCRRTSMYNRSASAKCLVYEGLKALNQPTAFSCLGLDCGLKCLAYSTSIIRSQQILMILVLPA